MPDPIVPAPITPVEPPVVPPVEPPLVPPSSELDELREKVAELQAKLDARTQLEVHRALSRSRMTKHPEHAKKFTILHPDGDGVLSVQPDGTIEKRPLGTTGAWETFSDDGQKACFADSTPGYTFAILLVG